MERGHVLLLATDQTLTSLLVQALEREGYTCLHHRALRDLLAAVAHRPSEVAIIDSADVAGLLAEEHRHLLGVLAHAVTVILLVDDRAWGGLLAEDLGVAAVVAKPLRLEDLLATVRRVSQSAARV